MSDNRDRYYAGKNGCQYFRQIWRFLCDGRQGILKASVKKYRPLASMETDLVGLLLLRSD